jgi:hypothetical protein
MDELEGGRGARAAAAVAGLMRDPEGAVLGEEPPHVSTGEAEVFPSADIRVFALVRTMGLVPDVERLVEPAVGVIELDGWGGANRWP